MEKLALRTEAAWLRPKIPAPDPFYFKGREYQLCGSPFALLVVWPHLTPFILPSLLTHDLVIHINTVPDLSSHF